MICRDLSQSELNAVVLFEQISIFRLLSFCLYSNFKIPFDYNFFSSYKYPPQNIYFFPFSFLNVVYFETNLVYTDFCYLCEPFL